MRINILPPYVFNRISAGEVVEKPASIVKELVENSIDAGATSIIIEIEDGGKKRISISDNGCGIDKEDLRSAFLPHATSKVKEVEDLDKIETLGFRGEALASISSVCHTLLTSKTADSEMGHAIEVNGGVIGEVKEIARTNGTTIEVRDIFFNTPARAKFLRKSKLEEGEVTHIIQKFMLANPQISFLYIIDGKQIYNTTSCELYDIIYTIYGKEVYDNLLPVDYQEDELKVKGVVVAPKVSKSNRTWQTLFVNERYVENYLVSSAIQGVYESFLMKGKFPIYVLDLIVSADSVDVNVHPTKKEVKFENSNRIFGFIRRAVENALLKANHVASFVFDTEPDETTEAESRDVFNKEGFNHVPVFDFDKIKESEGASFRKTSYSEPIVRNSVLSDEEEVKEVEVPKQSEVLQTNFEDKTNFFKDFRKDDSSTRDSFKSPFYFDQSMEKTIFNDTKISTQDIIKQSKLEEIKVVGAIFNTYIIAELGDSVFFIDQHAAHERTLFDKLNKEIDEKKVTKQNLLIPYAFEVAPKEIELIDKNMETLITLGFDIEDKGDGKYEISALPLVLSNISLKSFIDSLLIEGKALSNQPSHIIKDRLAQSACKHAIKGGDVLNKEMILSIIEQMKKGVLLCPHGRPICLELTKKEVEKMFKRIV